MTGYACPRSSAGTGSSSRPVALVLPTINEMALRWQAEARFCYTMPSATGMTGTNAGDVGQLPLILTIGQPGLNLPALTPGLRADLAEQIKSLHISEIIVAPGVPVLRCAPLVAQRTGSAHSVAGGLARACPGPEPRPLHHVRLVAPPLAQRHRFRQGALCPRAPL